MNFDECIEFILEEEGVYINNVKDRGGETKFGISKLAYPREDIKNLTREDAIELYRRDYWDKLGVDSLPEDVRLMYFDCAINQGPARAKQLYEMSKGDDTLKKFAKLRLKHYTSLPSWSTFGKGWAARILDITCLSLF